MGSKIDARRLMAAAGVPVVPGETPADQSDAGICAAVERVGLPVLVKASAGGGGKGMRARRDAGDVDEAIQAARREATAAFGDGTLYVERLVERPRHVEVQVFARQPRPRRPPVRARMLRAAAAQKVIEESPSPALTPSCGTRMTRRRGRAARAADYRNAGTIEFLARGSRRRAPFYFLEMNTRLQVEHPVTEAVTGVDLVRAQLLVAVGRAAAVAQARSDAARPRDRSARLRRGSGAGFLPQAAALLLYREPRLPGVRVDSGVAEGERHLVHYDPMLAKVIASAETRDAGDRAAVAALRDFPILGVRTNMPFLLRDPRASDVPRRRRSTPASSTQRVLAAHRDATPTRCRSPACRGRDCPAADVRVSRAGRRRHEPSSLERAISDGDRWSTAIGARRSPRRVIDGDAHVTDGTAGHLAAAGTMGVLDGQVFQFDVARRRRTPAARATQGSLAAPMPATVVTVLVDAGHAVKKGDTLVVLEAMKMELPIRALGDGVVKAVHCREGELVQAGRRRWSSWTVRERQLGTRSPIVEVGPRDGLQNEPAAVSTADKIAFVNRLSARGPAGHRSVGVRQPEVGAADGRCRGGVRRHRARARHPLHRARAEPRRPRTRARGRRHARSRSSPPRPRRSAARTSTSRSTSRSRPTRRSATARSRAGLRVRGYLSTAFGCPFEGDVAPRTRRRRRRAAARPRRLRGGGQRHDRHRASRPGPARARGGARALPLDRVALHFHDTRGTALANVLAALPFGITTFDASAGGLGGCPYAPGAAGNLATETRLHAGRLASRPASTYASSLTRRPSSKVESAMLCILRARTQRVNRFRLPVIPGSTLRRRAQSAPTFPGQQLALFDCR